MDNLRVLWESLGENAYILAAVLFCVFVHWINLIYKSVIICRKEKPGKKEKEEGVSVIITVNNKAEELEKNLVYFLEQDYPGFEVIVVDECSEDDTQDVLASFQQKYPHLRTTRIYPSTKFRSTKKLAINIGILAAQYDVLLFSEINCRPLSTGWVRSMQESLDEKTAVVLSYTNYKVDKEEVAIPRFFRFLRYLKMLILVRSGFYVMGDGCNMGYRKKYYLAQRGFSKNSQSYLGYDYEMVKALSKYGKVKVLKDEKANIEINYRVRKTWKEDFSYYYANKRRWPWQAVLKADFDSLIIFVFYALSIFLIFNNIISIYIIYFIILVFLIDFITINLYLKHLSQRKLFLTSFIVSSIGFLYRWYYSVYSIFTAKKWR